MLSVGNYFVKSLQINSTETKSLSLHREVGSVRQYMVKIAVRSAKGCCTATTVALTAIKQL